MSKFLHFIDSISEWTGKPVSFLTIPIMLIIVYEIVMRSVFNLPSIWAHELTCYLFAALFMLGGAQTFLNGGHVNMDIFVVRLSPRKRALIDIITFPLILITCGVIAWKASLGTIDAIRFGFKYGSAWAPPLWPLKGLVTLGTVLVILQALAKLYRDFGKVIGGSQK